MKLVGERSAHKHLTLCADDFGLAPGVNLAITDLIKANRINAVSCMTGMPLWKKDAPKLKEFMDKIQIGLHITLTDHNCIAPMRKLAPDSRLPNLKRLIKLAMTGHLDPEEIQSEIQRQYEAFYIAMGRIPDFIDGHHHIHQFPIIRNAVIKLIKNNDKCEHSWLRTGWESPFRVLTRGISVGRALSIGAFGLRLKRCAIQNDVAHNAGFVGVYDPARQKLDRSLLERFLTNAIDNTLMFCHPGLVDRELIQADKLTNPRELEYHFFQSRDFLEILSKTSFTLAPKDFKRDKN